MAVNTILNVAVTCLTSRHAVIQCSHLVIRRVTFVAASTLKEIRLSARVECHLMIIECLAGQLLTCLLHLITCHLFRRHDGKMRDGDMAKKNVLPKPGIFWILTIGTKQCNRDVQLCISTSSGCFARLFMAALCGFFLLLSFFSWPNLSHLQIGCLPYFRTWCGLSVNLECRSETCCKGLAENTGPKKIATKLPSGHHRKTLLGYIFATKARIDNRKKLLSSNISSTCPHNMVNFGPLVAEIVSLVWAPQVTSTGFASWQQYCTAL